MKKLLSILVVVILLTGCSNKSVMNGNADNVLQTFIYKGKDSTYVITKEIVAVLFGSGSAAAGAHHHSRSSSGYGSSSLGSNLRLTVYNINTGEIVKRKNMGDYIKNAYIILGVKHDKIWLCFSKKKQIEIQAWDLKTFEPVLTHEQIFAKQTNLGSQLSRYEITFITDMDDLAECFYIDPVTDTLFVTDNKGFHYGISLQNFEVTKYDDSFKMPSFHFPAFCEENSIPVDSFYLEFKGDTRKQFMVNNKVPDSNLSFIQPYFLVNTDVSNFLQTFQILYDGEKKYPMHYNFLTSGNNDYYFGYAETTDPTSSFCIGRFIVENDSMVEKKWEIQFDDIWFDIHKTPDLKSSKYKKEFSKGNPEFDYEFFTIVDNKLLIIRELRIICIDVNTGKVLWKKRI